ncbi:hypothetical protein [Bradyrhizobium iriomotense]|uniref:hypothetical protein n=1 Tax=Bradyrhizobium iriomotense TaxID=441950 RepID=UPI0024E0B2CD|nr:hypothetical protein [Bradyrhizobium iriomotense]
MIELLLRQRGGSNNGSFKLRRSDAESSADHFCEVRLRGPKELLLAGKLLGSFGCKIGHCYSATREVSEP